MCVDHDEAWYQTNWWMRPDPSGFFSGQSVRFNDTAPRAVPGLDGVISIAMEKAGKASVMYTAPQWRPRARYSHRRQPRHRVTT